MNLQYRYDVFLYRPVVLLMLCLFSILAFAQQLTTNLPIVVINTNGQEIPDEPKIEAEMGIINNGYGEENNLSDPFNGYDGYIGIEMRGQSAQYFYPKKSYSFETRSEDGSNLDVSILGMPEENDWILNGPYSDKSMLRNVLTFWIARKMDVYASRTVFCEVVINGEYMGVYVMMEKIKKDDQRVSIAKLRPEDNTGDELTGGYIIRVDKVDEVFELPADGWYSYPNPPFPNAMTILYQYYYPKSDEITIFQKNYIKNYILETENALIAGSFDDKDVGYNRFINAGSFVDQLLLNELSKEVDGYRYSTYFYKEKDSDGGKLFAGPAWDFNLGYANVDYWDDGIETTGWHYTQVEPVDWSIMFWWKRLMQDAYFRNLARTRWITLRNEVISDVKIQSFIDSVTTLIDEPQQRNYEKWPILGEYVWPNYDWQNNTYEDEVSYLEDWLFERLFWMDYSMPGVVVYPSAELAVSNNNLEAEVKLFDDYFSRRILKNKYFTINNAPSWLEIDSVVYEDASTARIYFENEWKGDAEISVTLDKKILNSFSDITTNTAIIGIGNPKVNYDDIEIIQNRNSLVIKTEYPDLLGSECWVFDVTGKPVQQVNLQQSHENRFFLNQPAGIYFCRIQFGGKMVSKKILVILESTLL